MGIFDSVREKMFGEQDQNKKLDSAQDQPKEDIELATFVKNKVEEVRAQANRVSHEGIWMTNIAYLLGFDSVYYDPTQRQFRPLSDTAGSSQYISRSRIHSNIILPDVQNRLARMLKNPPKYDVRPESMEEEDKEAARLGIEVINMVWDKQSVNRKRIDLGMWLMQCGHAYVKVSYDDDLGDPLPAIGNDQSPGFEGDIRIDVVSAFECFPDPLAKTFDECGYFTQAKVRKLEYFRQRYDLGYLVKEEGAWLLSAQYEMRINTLNSTGTSSSGTSEQMKNAAIEMNYYEKRSKKYPGGRHIIVANGVVLKNDVLPCGEIPFAKFDDVVVGGKYYSESLITHARPIVDQYNRLLQKRAQWENKLLAGKYIAAKGHGLIQEALNNQSGEVVEYNPVPNAAPPGAMSIPVMPEYAYTSTNDLENKVHNIFGLSEVSRGQLPSASIPAIGIQLLLEQDETRVGIEVESHEYSWARVGQLILKYADKCYVTNRKLKTKGRGLSYKVTEFDGKSLRGNFDCIVIRGSTVPNSKVINRQEIINLWQQGLMGAPQDPAVVQEVLGKLEYGEVGSVWKKYHIDMTQIQDSIEEIEEELKPEVNKLDNHMLHLMVKNDYRIEKGMNLSPLSMQLLEEDIATHTQMEVLLRHPELAQPQEVPPPAPPEVVASNVMDQTQDPSENDAAASQLQRV